MFLIVNKKNPRTNQIRQL